MPTQKWVVEITVRNNLWVQNNDVEDSEVGALLTATHIPTLETR